MHDLAVALDHETLGDLDCTGRGDPADVVAAEVEQHQMLGPFLGIGQQLGLEGAISRGRRAAGAGAGQRADGDLAVLQPHQDFRAGARQLEAFEVQVEQIGRGVLAAQRPVKGERIAAPVGREAVAQHHLEDVAGGDVVLGGGHHGGEGGFVDGRTEGGRGRRGRRRAGGQGLVQRGLEGLQPGVRLGPRSLGIGRVVGIGGGDQHDLVADRIEDGDQRGTGQHCVRQIERVRVGRAQRLQQPHHVIAEDAEQTRGHGRQVVGQVKPRGGDQGAERLEGRHGLRRELSGRHACAARQLGLLPPAAPDHVRVERQDRIAALDRAAFDRLQQAGIGPVAAELQEGRDRRLKVVDQPPDDDLRTAAGQTLDEADAARVLRLDHLAAGVVAGAAGVA